MARAALPARSAAAAASACPGGGAGRKMASPTSSQRMVRAAAREATAWPMEMGRRSASARSSGLSVCRRAGAVRGWAGHREAARSRVALAACTRSHTCTRAGAEHPGCSWGGACCRASCRESRERCPPAPLPHLCLADHPLQDAGRCLQGGGGRVPGRGAGAVAALALLLEPIARWRLPLASRRFLQGRGPRQMGMW